MKQWTMVPVGLLIGVGSASIALQAPQTKLLTTTASGKTNTMTLCSSPAGLLQPPPGGPGGFGGGQGRGGRGGRGGGPGRGGQEPTVATIPLTVLTFSLGLSDEQQTQIKAIEDKLKTERDALRPTDGQRPDPSKFAQLQADEKQAVKDITALLSADQQTKLTALLADMKLFRAAGLPPELVSTLQLTADQKTQIAAIEKDAQAQEKAAMDDGQNGGDRQATMQAVDTIRKAAHDKIMALMTDDQKAAVTKYQKAHPQGGPGGRGGGPGGGGPDGGGFGGGGRGHGGPPPDGGGGPGGGPDGGPGGPPPGEDGPDGMPPPAV